MMKNFQYLLLTVLCAGLNWLGFQELNASQQELSTESKKTQEVLFLPKESTVRSLAFGAENVLSNILWFNLISYFGKHYQTDHNYDWLAHMCHLVTELDPRATHTYDFCALMLTWEANRPDLGRVVLDKALTAHPDKWRFHYLSGINASFFEQNPSRAKEDFVNGSKLKDSPSFLAKLAAKQLATENTPGDALVFLERIIRQTTNPLQRESLIDHYKRARYETEVQVIEQAIQKFEAKIGWAPENMTELIQEFPDIPRRDPFNRPYEIEHTTGKVKTMSEMERVRFLSRTKKEAS